jgi:hypothetical protein
MTAMAAVTAQRVSGGSFLKSHASNDAPGRADRNTRMGSF